MLYEIMKSIHNFFSLEDQIQEGTFTITGGTVSFPFLSNGQYFIIEGSLLNDFKVFKYGDDMGLQDETFTGAVVPLKVPDEFITLCDEIDAYRTQYASNINPYDSESFGGYSYTKGKNASGALLSWKDVFKDRLYVWRKI